ncbi:MAG: trypsin-like peptidase domain-containing protein [Pyrinomonadaceae bacterium]
MIFNERTRFETEIAALREVFDSDTRDRVPISQTLAVPYRWICRLTVPNVNPTEKGYGAGTGVLVGPRHVLTAAHVLISETDPGKTVGDRLRVQPARNGQDKPFEEVRVAGWQVNPQWILRHGNGWRLQPQHDYGLVTLKKDVSAWRDRRLGGCSLGYWGLPDRCGAGSIVGITPNLITGQNATVTGYPGDRPAATLWIADGALNHDNRLDMLIHTIDTKGGQSGAPVWIMRNGVACLVGIHSGASGRWSSDASGTSTLTHNAAVILTPATVNNIESWKSRYTR